MMTEEDVARLLDADRHVTETTADAQSEPPEPELEEAWAMIVAARTLLRDYALDADKRACAQQLARVAKRQIEALMGAAPTAPYFA